MFVIIRYSIVNNTGGEMCTANGSHSLDGFQCVMHHVVTELGFRRSEMSGSRIDMYMNRVSI